MFATVATPVRIALPADMTNIMALTPYKAFGRRESLNPIRSEDIDLKSYNRFLIALTSVTLVFVGNVVTAGTTPNQSHSLLLTLLIHYHSYHCLSVG